MINGYCNLVTLNTATVTNSNNTPIGECFRVSWYTIQTSDYSKARINGLLTRTSRRPSRALCSELKVLIANIILWHLNKDDGFIH